MSEIPVREMIKNAIESLGGRATHKQLKNWVNEKYQNVNQNTLSTQINTCTVNMAGRVGMSENDHPREFDSRYDFLYSVGRGEVVFYEPKIHGNWSIINDESGKTVIAKDGIPISKSPTSNDLPLLVFLKQKTLFRNYVPIIIKLLLEERNETRFTISIEEIRKNFDKLNFNRSDYNFHDALRAAQGALDGFVTFSDETASFHLDQLDGSDIPECLKICGQKIAQYHIKELTNNKFDLYHILPGSRNENFMYLDEFLKTNSIGIGWDKVRNIKNLPESEIKKEFDKNYESGFASFASFMKIKPKDIVVLTKGQKEIVDFGIVVSDYEFKDVTDPSYPHRKNVVWLNQGPIPADDLPGKKLAGFMDTASVVREKRDMLIEVLLGKQTMAAYKTNSCFILTQFADSKYDDVEGSKYHYTNQVANSRKLVPGSKFIIQSKIDGKNNFVGFGKIGNIQESDTTNEKGKPIKDILANFSEFTPMDPPKIRTEQILSEMQSMPSYGSQPPSILPITRSLYLKITGDDLGENVNDVDMSEISKIIQILDKKKNVILYGPPGTGKTYTTQKVQDWFESKNLGNSNNDSVNELAIFLPYTGEMSLLRMTPDFISTHGKIFWSLSKISDEKINEFNFPMIAYLGQKEKIVAKAKITAIHKIEDLSKDDLEKFHSWSDSGFTPNKTKIELEFKEISLIENPFPSSNLEKLDGTKLDSKYISNFQYVKSLEENVDLENETNSEKQFFMLMGPFENWKHNLSLEHPRWATTDEPRNLGHYKKMKIGDYVILKNQKNDPGPFNEVGYFGIGKITKLFESTEPFWPDEIEAQKIIWKNCLEFELLYRSDKVIPTISGLPGTKGLSSIKSSQKLDSLLEIISTEWGISIDSPKVQMVTFHPSYSYEDFVEGIRPVVTNDEYENSESEKISYSLEDGIFKKICKHARNDSKNDYLLIIDEINRGNVSKIFGELITLIEDDKRDTLDLHLAYSKEPFSVPKNLYILGTMNTADKSLVQIDTALRRRFAFVELMTKYDLPQLEFKIDVTDKEGNPSKKSLKQLLQKLNEILINKKLRDKQIGHSYFLNISSVDDLKFTFQYEIIPLLQDYFFGEFDKLADVLGDKFISKDQMKINENVFEDSEFAKALGQIFEK